MRKTMKKFLFITLIIAFVSTSSIANIEKAFSSFTPVQEPVKSFVLTKALVQDSVLLKNIDTSLASWGSGIPCSLCERNERACINSGQSYSFCLQQLINWFNTCTGMIP
jgi:hypothetical protein